MIKANDRIIIDKMEDSEIYNLLEKIEVTKFGVIRFEEREIKEIKMKDGRPHQIITIEKSNLL